METGGQGGFRGMKPVSGGVSQGNGGRVEHLTLETFYAGISGYIAGDLCL